MFYFVQRALYPGAPHRPVLQTEPGGDNDLGGRHEEFQHLYRTDAICDGWLL